LYFDNILTHFYHNSNIYNSKSKYGGIMRKGWLVAFLIFALVGMSACGVETNKLVKKNMEHPDVLEKNWYTFSVGCDAVINGLGAGSIRKT
jgi:hypothetical protein